LRIAQVGLAARKHFHHNEIFRAAKAQCAAWYEFNQHGTHDHLGLEWQRRKRNVDASTRCSLQQENTVRECKLACTAGSAGIGGENLADERGLASEACHH
jgi:hypothetical protein